ncbi:MAG TPA: glycerophosphodiester phosphodiesterase [Thermomicrobiales bacterium]|jgi:glycerophosphoryl diester phosphodiesterase
MRRIQRTSAPLIIAHRGASADAPENTLAAFRLAIAQGADGLECDLRMSADGVIVISHDDSLKRTYEHPIRIAEATAAQLAAHGVPTLAETLDTVRGKLPLINLELKEPIPPDTLDATIGAQAEGIILSSFDTTIIETTRAALPQLPFWLLTHHGTNIAIATARELGCVGINVSHRTATPRFIAHAGRAGFPVYVWTLDDLRRAGILAGRGIAGITTNTPGELRALFATATNGVANTGDDG